MSEAEEQRSDEVEGVDSDVSESGQPEAGGRAAAADVAEELKDHEEEAESSDGEE